jgi:hypothetical protein
MEDDRCYKCKGIAQYIALMPNGKEIYCCKRDIPKFYRELWEL